MDSSKKSHKEYMKEYNILNRESLSIKRKEYSKNNKEELKEYKKNYYLLNKESISEKSKKWYQDTKESRKEKNKQYRDDNKERIRQYKLKNKERFNKYKLDNHKSNMENDPIYRFKFKIRQRMKESFRRYGYRKTSATRDMIGLDFIEFKSYLESKFESWMNWENYGKYNGELNFGWDIDHIIPLSAANNQEEIIKLNHYTNLQPLCSKVNRDIKKDKIEWNTGL